MNTLIAIINQNNSKIKNISRLYAKCKNIQSHQGYIVGVYGCKRCKRLICGACITKDGINCVYCISKKKYIAFTTYICHFCGKLCDSAIIRGMKNNMVVRVIANENEYHFNLCKECSEIDMKN